MQKVSGVGMTKVSVIIPCYNQGAYIDEAVDTVLAQTFRDFEIIIVNDGSTDEATNRLLAVYCKPQTRVINTENQGVALARNVGIREACGKYILSLDADDRIAPIYLEKAVAVLESAPEVGIVYCLADCFGVRQGRWLIPDFSLRGMLLTNLIFCTALYRKEDWERTGGYNPNMSAGWEDWDFWLSLLELGLGVNRIPEVLFYYRIAEGSRERSMDREKQITMHLQLMQNHPRLFVDQARPLLTLYYRLRDSWPYRLAKRIHLPNLVGRFLGGRS